MQRAVVTVIGQQFDEEKRLFDIGFALKRKSWSVAAGLLIVQIDVEQFAGFQRPGRRDGQKFVGPAMVSWATSGFTPTISG